MQVAPPPTPVLELDPVVAPVPIVPVLVPVDVDGVPVAVVLWVPVVAVPPAPPVPVPLESPQPEASAGAAIAAHAAASEITHVEAEAAFMVGACSAKPPRRQTASALARDPAPRRARPHDRPASGDAVDSGGVASVDRAAR
jgi:hypothetical protein